MSFIPVYLIFIPIISAMIIYMVNNKNINYLSFVSQGIISILAIIYYINFDGLKNPQILNLGGWEKDIGIALLNDKLSISFIFLSIIIWWIVLIYDWSKRKEEYKFLFFLLFLEGAFIGFLQTNDLFNFFVLIELVTILSTILIVYKKDGFSVRAGIYYLIFNSVGMIFYLIGLILLYSLSGTLNMEVIANRISLFPGSHIVELSYIFIIASMGVKSAFFPVYTWLPRAHGAAPASISALLSGLLVKSGLYGFIRINQMFKLEILEEFFFVLGFVTALSGVIFALSQKDIKQILAFHTISQVGIILMGLEAMEGRLFIGGVMHIFNHAIFKSLLFLGAGIIINQYGTRRITEIRGVFKESPIVSIFMIVGMLSITGAPLFNGFVSKSIIKYGLKGNDLKVFSLQILNLGTAISFVKFSQIFFGKSKVNKIKDISSTVGLGILAILCIIMGNFFSDIVWEFMMYNVSYIKVFTFKNILTYVITIGIGYLVYKGIIDKDYPIIKKIRHINISFENSNIMLVAFIFIMLIWTRIKV